MPVVAALELHNDLAPGSRPRQPDRRHRRLRSRADKAHLLNRRIARNNPLSQIRLRRRRSPEAGRVPCRPLNRLHHRRKRVPQNHRPPRAEIVDVAVPVRVDKICALRPLHKRRRPAHRPERPHRRVHPAREKALRALLKRLRSGANPCSICQTHSPTSIEVAPAPGGSQR